MADLSEPIEDWWTDFAHSLRRATAVTLRRECTARPRPLLGLGFTDKLVASGVADATVSIVRRNLRPFFSWWAKEADAPNPFNGADDPAAKDDKPPATISLDDIRAPLATCSGVAHSLPAAASRPDT